MKNKASYLFVNLLLLISLFACVQEGNTQSKSKKAKTSNNQLLTNTAMDTATFGAGCFWCVEAIFQRVEGVHKVVSGYMGGNTKNPTYKEVCTGTTNHAEVCQVIYDPTKVSFEELLEIFWKTHDPTTLNRQGADVGTQYRSAIFYHNETQKQLAEKYKKALIDEKVFERPIVTEIAPAQELYIAEDYHQNYFNDNPNQGYCAFVIAPKVEKFRKVFKAKLKKSE
jgi:peptide-methionine (S)-S-oxide reductase